MCPNFTNCSCDKHPHLQNFKLFVCLFCVANGNNAHTPLTLYAQVICRARETLHVRNTQMWTSCTGSFIHHASKSCRSLSQGGCKLRGSSWVRGASCGGSSRVRGRGKLQVQLAATAAGTPK